MKSVSFVETTAQTLALAGRTPSNLVATGAQAEYALTRAGLSFSVPDDYFSSEDVRSLKDESLRRVYRLCAELDEKAARFFPDAPGFLPFSAHLFSIRHLLDHALYTAWRADRILCRRPVEKAFIFSTPDEEIGEGLFFKNESIWSRVLPLVCRARGVSFELLGEAREPRPWPSWRTAAARLGRAAAGLAQGWRGLGKPDQNGLVFLSRNYSLGPLMDFISPELPTALWRLDRWEAAPVPADRSAMLSLWDEWRHGRAMRPFFMHDGIDLFPILEKRLRHLFVELVPRAAAVYRAFAARLDVERPKAVLAATMSWREKAAAAAARATQRSLGTTT